MKNDQYPLKVEYGSNLYGVRMPELPSLSKFIGIEAPEVSSYLPELPSLSGFFDTEEPEVDPHFLKVEYGGNRYGVRMPELPEFSMPRVSGLLGDSEDSEDDTPRTALYDDPVRMGLLQAGLGLLSVPRYSTNPNDVGLGAATGTRRNGCGINNKRKRKPRPSGTSKNLRTDYSNSAPTPIPFTKTGCLLRWTVSPHRDDVREKKKADDGGQ